MKNLHSFSLHARLVALSFRTHQPAQSRLPVSRFGLAALFAAAILLTGAAHGADFTNVNFLTGSTPGLEVLTLTSDVNLQGGPFPYNTMADATGAKLATDDGGYADFRLSGSSTAGAPGTVSLILNPSTAPVRIRASHGFTEGLSSNNPGSVNANTFTLRFADHLTVTYASFNFNSLNTAAITWEYSVIQFLDTNGNPFSALSGLNFAPGAASQYLVGDVIGYSGQAGVGNWVSASKLTVQNVGSIQTSIGTSGEFNSIASLDYIMVGLSSGTPIGGIRWSTYLEDVRGTANGSTSATSSLSIFTISGTIESPIVIDLSSLRALILDDGVHVEWTAETQINVAGYHVYRSGSETGEYARLTETMIAVDAKSAGNYEYVDCTTIGAGCFYKLEEINLDGNSKFYCPIAATAANEVGKEVELPTEFSLGQNYPNPFNPTTMIAFDLPVAGVVTLTAYDINGRQVDVLLQETLPAGRHQQAWDAANFPSGVYFIQMQTEGSTAMQRVMLLK